jgi:hypothetical protein
LLRISAQKPLFNPDFHGLIPVRASARIDSAAMHTSILENLAAQRLRSAAGVSPSDESICWAVIVIDDYD